MQAVDAAVAGLESCMCVTRISSRNDDDASTFCDVAIGNEIQSESMSGCGSILCDCCEQRDRQAEEIESDVKAGILPSNLP